jgi:hypothetical protein
MKDIISRVYSGALKGRIRVLLVYNGLEYDAEHFMGVITGGILAVSCILALAFSGALGVPFAASFAVCALALTAAVYSFLTLRADNRGLFVESILPDVLNLMSSNLRAGLSIERSLMMATRPQFVHFNDEIQWLASRVMAGDSFESALRQMSVRIKSTNFAVTIDLVIQGIRSGGELSSALDRIADILRDREFVRKEIRTGVQMYVTFVIFAILVGAPLLFGVSSFLVELLQSMSHAFAAHGTPLTQGGNNIMTSTGGAGIQEMPFSVDFIRQYATVSLLTTSILGSVVIGLINTGNWRRGLKYVPVFCVVSVSLFQVINKVLEASLGGMFT